MKVIDIVEPFISLIPGSDKPQSKENYINDEQYSKKKKCSFRNDFKKQMVMLHQNGKKRADIVAEYYLTKSALNKWITQYQTTGSFTAKDNRSAEENELIALRKENKRLLMENDILKQVALIISIN